MRRAPDEAPHRTGSIVALRDEDGDGRADRIAYFGGDSGGTGIGFHDGHLYFASDDSVVRYALKADELVPSAKPERIVSGFPEQRQHAVKPFTFDDEGWIYVDVGAPSNACQERSRTPGSPGLDPCPQLERQAGIWRFRADTPDQDQQAQGFRYATGIRHAVALDWNHAAGRLYAVQHGRDQLATLWPDLFDDARSAELPAEEFLLVKEGSDFGWPYGYYDPYLKKRVLAPEYGGDGKKTDRCETFEDPIMAFPAHWAPNDLIFYRGEAFGSHYQNGAFIAFHGSWNRYPLEQQGYKVVFVPFSGEKPSGAYEVFADGFAGEGPIRRSRDAAHRPVGLAEAPDGSLVVTDSVKGRVWRIFRK